MCSGIPEVISIDVVDLDLWTWARAFRSREEAPEDMDIARCFDHREREIRHVESMQAEAGLTLQKPERKPQIQLKVDSEPSGLWLIISSDPSIMQRRPANIQKRPKKVMQRYTGKRRSKLIIDWRAGGRGEEEDAIGEGI